MKLYQIYEESSYYSCGFHEHDEGPMRGPASETIFTTYDKAKEHLPSRKYDDYGGCSEYYIKEIEIE